MFLCFLQQMNQIFDGNIFGKVIVERNFGTKIVTPVILIRVTVDPGGIKYKDPLE